MTLNALIADADPVNNGESEVVIRTPEGNQVVTSVSIEDGQIVLSTSA